MDTPTTRKPALFWGMGCLGYLPFFLDGRDELASGGTELPGSRGQIAGSRTYT